jgi:hypothetical protein
MSTSAGYALEMQSRDGKPGRLGARRAAVIGLACVYFGLMMAIRHELSGMAPRAVITALAVAGAVALFVWMRSWRGVP